MRPMPAHQLLLVGVVATGVGCAPAMPGDDDDPADTETPTCATPAWQVPHQAADAARTVVFARTVLLEAGGALQGRSVVLSATGRGSVTVDVPRPFDLATADGAPLALPATFDADALPVTLLLGARREVPEAAALVATPGEGCPPASLEVVTARWPTIAVGRRTDDEAGLWPTRLLHADEAVVARLDLTGLDDRLGLEARVHVVPHASAAERLADPTLDDATGSVETVVLGAEAATRPFRLAPAAVLAPGPGAHPTSWDVVLDFGDDGRVDPGDLVLGIDASGAFAVADDLAAPGPYAVTQRFVRGPGMFRDQQLFWPSDAPAGQRVPLVVVSHGNGHDLTWYDHIGTHLASWGFVVTSHRNNTEPGIEAASVTTHENTEYLLANLDTMVDGALADLVDPTRIGWVGHSRGGEGIVRAWRRVASGDFLPTTYGPDDVRALFSIAPTVFEGVGRSNPLDVPYVVVVGGADGDVTGGADCDLCQSMRIAGAALGQARILNVQGASHNVFHNGVGSFDDGVGPDQVGRRLVHPLLNGLLLAWAGEHLLGIEAYAEVWAQASAPVPPIGFPPEVIRTATTRGAYDERDATFVDHFQESPEPGTASSGASVACTGVTPNELRFDDADSGFGWDGREISNGMTLAARDGFAAGLVVTWDAPGSCAWTLPAPEDVRDAFALDVSATRLTRHPSIEGGPAGLAFAVELVDADGTVARVTTRPAGLLPVPYPREGGGPGRGWGNEWHTLRLPLAAFRGAAPVDLGRVVEVRLVFGEDDAVSGALGIDDLAFVR
jgi:dienelactone hydrolase